jgi:ribonuclease G
MSKELVISAAPHETRVAIVEDGQLCEIYVEREKEFALVGSIYKGRVTRVLPGMQSAFVDIGLDTDAFLYVSDFIEGLEDYDQVSTVETKVQKMEQEGGAVFAPPAAGGPEEAPPADAAAPERETAPVTEEAAELPAGPESAASAEPAPLATPSRSEDLPGESRAMRPAGSAPPEPGRDSRGRDDFRGRGRFGGRGDRDRRGGGRGGRDRFGRRGGRDLRGNRGGREFPSSKYASPHRPYEPPAADTEARENTASEPIILPGESLSKYRGKEAAGLNAAVGPAEENLQISREPSAAYDELHAEAQFAGGASLPAAAPVPSSSEEPASPGEPAPESMVAETSLAVSPAEMAEARSEAPAAALPSPGEADAEPELTEAQRFTLAAQLAEVEHEAAEAAAALESAELDAQEERAEAGGASDATEPEDERPSASDEGSEPVYDSDEQDAEIREGILAAAHGSMEETSPAERQPANARIASNPRARFQRPMHRGGRRQHGRDRGHGGRPQHFRGRPQAPKRTQLISELLKAGQEIIVQIAKEPLGKKGARITSHVALPGRYLVYMPTVNHIGVSRKINSGDKRSRLRHLVHEAKTKYPGGFIVRTAAENATEEEIQTDIDFLGRSWLEMLSKSEQRKAPALLHRDLNLVERILRDHLSSDYTSIWIDSEEEYTKVLEFVGRFQPALVNRVKLYTKDTPIFEELGIQQEIDKSLRPKVWLKSGGYIVINHTEALVAIDVNTGKFVGKGSTRLEDTIVRTNIEAVKEVVRQIRLRDLGGIIVVDFIDMEERKNRDKVMHALEDALRSDRAPSKVLPFNEFGLVAITRKRTKQALERVLCQPCPYCTGSGMVKSVPTICYEIQAEARKMALEMDGASITLRVNPEIAKALKTRESALIEELEHWTRKSVIIQGDPTLHFEQYDIH